MYSKDSKEDQSALAIHFPKADKGNLIKQTKENPSWVHFGGGNLYRGFHAEVGQRLVNQELLKSGIVVCETFDEEVIDRVYQPFDNDFSQVIMFEDGRLQVNHLNATAASYFCHPSRLESFQEVQQIFQQDSLQLVTLTITEKGYGIHNSYGELLPVIQTDINKGPAAPQHTMSILAGLLWSRYQSGGQPLAMVSTDNFSQNGRVFRASILKIAEGWLKGEQVTQGFIDYLSDEKRVSFPWTMIDRITPNPSEAVAQKLRQAGLDNTKIIRTSKGTQLGTFANTEETHYLVMEDHFPNGRPKLEAAGVIMTDRQTVDLADTMKVTACLNPLHTALAVFGCLLGYQSIAAEMTDSQLVELVKRIGYQEGLPVVTDPKIIHPKSFIDEVIGKRLVNPMIPDTPQRIAADTSQKVGIRFGETIKKNAASTDKKASELTYIPLAIAGWVRYLLAVTDEGEPMTLSPDPLLDELQEQLSALHLGYSGALHDILQPILGNQQIFSVDLYTVGLGGKIEGYVKEMLAGPGAVRKTLEHYLG